MAVSLLDLPPITQDLWPALRDRVSTAKMATILGGAGRVHLEGEYSGTPGVESTPWGRGVIVPVLPPGGVRWVPGLPIRLRFLFRTDFNDFRGTGYNVSRAADAAQLEGATQLDGWEGPLTSTQIMIVGDVMLDEVWSPRVLYDPDVTGTVYASSSYYLDAARVAP